MDWSAINGAVVTALTHWISPVNAAKGLLLIVWLTFLFRAQKSGRIDMVDTLRGDDGKASAARALFYAAWIVMSWTMMQYVFVKGDDPKYLVELFIAYGVVFVAPKMYEKFIEAKYGAFKRDDDHDHGEHDHEH